MSTATKCTSQPHLRPSFLQGFLASLEAHDCHGLFHTIDDFVLHPHAGLHLGVCLHQRQFVLLEVPQTGNERLCGSCLLDCIARDFL
jgi:hypothetical protein